MSLLVLFETFGGTLQEQLNVDELQDHISTIEGIASTIQVGRLNYSVLTEEVEKYRKLCGNEASFNILAVSGSRTRLEEPLRRAMKESNLDPNQLVLLNLREHVALVHDNKKEATHKAKSLISAAVEKAKMATPLERKKIQRFNEVLVIGGGVAGIHAALDLVKQNIVVNLVEREPTIGGMLPLLGRTFPEDSCAICIGGPKMADISSEPDIKLYDYSEVTDIERLPVGFKVTVKRKPRYIDVDKCVACGQCAERCPVLVPNETDGYMSNRKAIYIPYEQAEPRKYLIDSENCLYLTKGSCRLCERVCPNQAVEFTQTEESIELYVGSIIAATGFENFDAIPYPKYGAHYDDIIDQFQLARLLDGEGPTAGELFKPSNGEKPKKVIMLQCVGSRDPEENPWCSRYCCMAAMKHAEEIRLEQGSNIDVTILYKDIRASGKYYEEFYNRVKRLGVDFVNGYFDQVTKLDDGTFIIQYSDPSGVKSTLTGDMVVLSTGMVPSKGTEKLADLMGVDVDKFGFFAEVDTKVASVTTKVPGVYICGTCHAPKDIPESVAQASAAAAMTSLYLLRAVNPEKEILSPVVNSDNCGRCGICVSVCPYNALSLLEEGPVVVNHDLCQACGLCISSCPTGALDNPNYGYDLTDIQVRRVLEERDPKETSIVGFLCNDCGYNLLDTAGFYGAKYTPDFLPVFVPCMSNISLRHIANAVDRGADGIMLIGCTKDRCHYEKGVDHANSQVNLIENLYSSVGKKLPIRILESCGSMLQQFLDQLTGLVDEIDEVKKK